MNVVKFYCSLDNTTFAHIYTNATKEEIFTINEALWDLESDGEFYADYNNTLPLMSTPDMFCTILRLLKRIVEFIPEETADINLDSYEYNGMSFNNVKLKETIYKLVDDYKIFIK